MIVTVVDPSGPPFAPPDYADLLGRIGAPFSHRVTHTGGGLRCDYDREQAAPNVPWHAWRIDGLGLLPRADVVSLVSTADASSFVQWIPVALGLGSAFDKASVHAWRLRCACDALHRKDVERRIALVSLQTTMATIGTATQRKPATERSVRIRTWLDTSWFAFFLPPTVAVDIRVMLDENARLREREGGGDPVLSPPSSGTAAVRPDIDVHIHHAPTKEP